MGKEQRRLYLPGKANQILVVPGRQHVTKDAALKALTVTAEPAAIRIDLRKLNTARPNFDQLSSSPALAGAFQNKLAVRYRPSIRT
jgi:hypothetical protein